ncbi:MAG: hypothetical protein ACR2GY_08445 [Phycisphaerales bacterium]
MSGLLSAIAASIAADPPEITEAQIGAIVDELGITGDKSRAVADAHHQYLHDRSALSDAVNALTAWNRSIMPDRYHILDAEEQRQQAAERWMTWEMRSRRQLRDRDHQFYRDLAHAFPEHAGAIIEIERQRWRQWQPNLRAELHVAPDLRPALDSTGFACKTAPAADPIKIMLLSYEDAVHHRLHALADLINLIEVRGLPLPRVNVLIRAGDDAGAASAGEAYIAGMMKLVREVLAIRQARQLSISEIAAALSPERSAKFEQVAAVQSEWYLAELRELAALLDRINTSDDRVIQQHAGKLERIRTDFRRWSQSAEAQLRQKARPLASPSTWEEQFRADVARTVQWASTDEVPDDEKGSPIAEFRAAIAAATQQCQQYREELSALIGEQKLRRLAK